MQSVLRYVDWTSAGLAVSVALLTLLLLEIFRFNYTRRRLPPGPTPLPFIGNMHQILKNFVANIRELPKYGEITTVYMGKKPIIMLNNLQVFKEAFVQNGAKTSGKPVLPLLKWMNRSSGIFHANGTAWKEQRRFTLHTLRDFGLGRKTLEERVVEEAGFLIKEMLKHEGKPFSPMHPIMNAVSNIICSIVFGDRFDYDNKQFAKLLHLVDEMHRLAGSPVGLIFNLFPFMRHFPGPHQKIYQNAMSLQEYICEAVEERRKTLDPEHLRDFIEAYLVEITKQESNDSSFHEDNIVACSIDLFLAGTETTAMTLRWGLVFMMENPKIQEHCHEEIVSVLGYDRIPTMDDRVRLPYTYATIHEVQRCANIVPTGVGHETTDAFQLLGYHFTKGTVMMPNLTAILADKDHWKHPETFNPENFLDEKGQFCKRESFLPFSLGPRVCLGEPLARMELFIFFTCLLQHLHFSWPPGAPPYNMEGVQAPMRPPFPFHMICRSRETSH